MICNGTSFLYDRFSLGKYKDELQGTDLNMMSVLCTDVCTSYVCPSLILTSVLGTCVGSRFPPIGVIGGFHPHHSEASKIKHNI